MARDRRRRKQASDHPAPEPRAPHGWILLLPVLVVVVLNLPCLTLGYFWDDFYFLSLHGHGALWARFLPDPHAAFYRPIPLGIYFGVLRLLDPVNGVLGHVLNLAALVGAVALLVTLVSRLCGPRAGLLSGLIFASYGNVPGLVAWTSGSQDLFAILFVTAAFLLRHRGKDIAALACAAAGLLCKEPAIAAFPVLVLWDRIVGRPAKRPWLQLVGYAAVALVWASVHPGIHLLAGRGFRSGSTMYVGIEHPERWGLYLGRYLLTLANLPPPRFIAPWWEERALYGFAALAVLVAGLWYLDRPRRPGGASGSLSLARLGWISALFALPGILMPTILVRHWAPYFACLPGLGVAMLLGPVLARRGRLTAIAALGAFLLFGIWCRGVRAEGEWVLSEPAMVDASSAVRLVRANLEKEFPTFPKGSQVVASFGTTGIRGIQSALIDGQALSLWYRDPTLRTVRINERRPGAAPEYLIRVADDLDVLAVDLDTMRVRSAMRPSPNLAEIHRPVINYARAVAAGGDTDRAIRILEGLNRIEPAELDVFNNRMMASMLLAAGRRGEADSILAKTAPFPKDVAVALVQGLLAEASPSEQLDNAAFEAFGLSGVDPPTLRSIVLGLQRNGSMAQAAWFALKLKQLAPGDGESAEVLRMAAQMGVTPQREPSIQLAAPPPGGS
jgi:hypothetical protein